MIWGWLRVDGCCLAWGPRGRACCPRGPEVPVRPQGATGVGAAATDRAGAGRGGGSPGPARPPTLRLGHFAQATAQLRASQLPRGSEPACHPWAGAAGCEPQAGLPCCPLALPQAAGALPRALAGPRPPPAAARRWSPRPMSLQRLGAKEVGSPDGLPRKERSRGRFGGHLAEF